MLIGRIRLKGFSHRYFTTMATSSQAQAAPTVNRNAHPFERANLEELLTRRFFMIPSFQIYGGCSGFYDFGPPGSSLQANIIDAWRKHFVIEEEMLEVDTTVMTLEKVFQASGHVEKFTDWKCKDLKTGDTYRADHLVKDVLEARLKGDLEARGADSQANAATTDSAKDAKRKKKVKSTAVRLEDAVIEKYNHILATLDNLSGPDLGQIIVENEIKAPSTGNDLSPPAEFQLMFDASIGPTGKEKGYLRPETAQGHFINFGRLLEFNNGKIPFASAQVGKAFRNEISPRQGLLRVREFFLAEIEHYVDPKNKDHPRFKEVSDQKLKFLSKTVQLDGKTDIIEMSIGEAVNKGMVNNQTLGYFMTRIYLFLMKIGMDTNRIRFRQHMDEEMAHYATDCWDAEILTSYGWIECVGCADRSAYDLSKHSAATSTKLVARRILKEPQTVDVLELDWEKKKMGPAFKKDAKIVEESVEAFDQDRRACVQAELEKDGQSTIEAHNGQKYTILKEHLQIIKKTVTRTVEEYTPNVIEPSFGIGRILYALLEHVYWAREDDAQRGILSFPLLVAPTKVLLVPLSAKEELKQMTDSISYKFRKLGISSRVDDSTASIGKRYARNDELGTPYGITVDFATVKNSTLTLRDRDTRCQRIGSIDEVVSAVASLCDGTSSWEDICERLPEYTGQQDV